MIARDPCKAQLSARQPVEQPAYQGCWPQGLGSRQVIDCRTGGGSKAGNQRNRFGARPNAGLLPAAAHQWHGRGHAGGHIQRTHAHRAIAFVSREAEIVDVERSHINGNFACCLGSIAVNVGANAVSEGRNLCDWLNDARLVIHEHYRDQQDIFIEQCGQSFKIETPMRIHRRNCDFKSLCGKGGRRFQHRLMFDRRHDNAPPRGHGSRRRCNAEHREIIRFGRPGGKYDLRRSGADQCADVRACIGNDSRGSFARSVGRSCIAGPFPNRQHCRTRFIRQWKRGESIEINGRQLHISRARAQRRGSCYG